MRVKISASEIGDGTKYEGTISFEGRQLRYSISYSCGIDGLDEYEDPLQAIRQIDVALEDESGQEIVLDEMTKVLIVYLATSATTGLFRSGQRCGFREERITGPDSYFGRGALSGIGLEYGYGTEIEIEDEGQLLRGLQN